MNPARELQSLESLDPQEGSPQTSTPPATRGSPKTTKLFGGLGGPLDTKANLTLTIILSFTVSGVECRHRNPTLNPVPDVDGPGPPLDLNHAIIRQELLKVVAYIFDLSTSAEAEGNRVEGA